MRFLLDTHMLIWWLTNARDLPPHFHTTISNPAHQVYVSIISVWEMTIKQSVGKLHIPADLEQQLERHQFQLLPLNLAHVRPVADLPLVHRDPFDRLLICQAMAEDMVFLSTDRVFRQYTGLKILT